MVTQEQFREALMNEVARLGTEPTEAQVRESIKAVQSLGYTGPVGNDWECLTLLLGLARSKKR